MSTSYSELAADVLAWVEEDSGGELNTDIDTIIRLAQARIKRDTQIKAFNLSATLGTTATSASITTPSGTITIRGLRLEGGAYLLQKDESFIREFQASATTLGTPRYYAWSGNGDTIVIVPTASAATNLVCDYTAALAALTATNTTNWFTSNAEDVLLYGCIVESLGFLKGEVQDKEYWLTLYQRAIDTLNKEQGARMTDQYRRTEVENN